MVEHATERLNKPTSWFWNIRVGDKLQINGSGLWYTVVGPMVVTPQQGNSELFVNVGPAGTPVAVSMIMQGRPSPVYPEFLFLVNGLDDNKNGWIDEGYDGVDNNLSFEIANGGTYLTDELAEWEARGLAARRSWPIRRQHAVHDPAAAGAGRPIPARSRCRRTW